MKTIGKFLAWAFLYLLIALVLWGTSENARGNHETAVDTREMITVGRALCAINAQGEPMFEEEAQALVSGQALCRMAIRPTEESVYLFFEDLNGQAISVWRFNAKTKERKLLWRKGRVDT